MIASMTAAERPGHEQAQCKRTGHQRQQGSKYHRKFSGCPSPGPASNFF
jgi:hypothetical protein